MKIRVTCAAAEVREVVAALREAFDVRYEGAWTRWTRDDPASKLGAFYVDAELRDKAN